MVVVELDVLGLDEWVMVDPTIQYGWRVGRSEWNFLGEKDRK